MEDKQTDKPTSTGLRNRRLTIGYLPVSIGSLGQPMLAGMVDVARERDVNLICFPGGSLLDPAGYWAQRNIVYEFVNAENVNGVVSWASQIGTYLTVDEIRALHDRYRPLPVVTIGRTLEGFPGVLIDSHEGMREAVSHLIEVHGCRRLAFIRGPESHLYAQERYRAYTETLEAHGLPVDPNLITPPSPWGPATGREAMHLLLDERGLRPHTDFQAIVSVSEDTLFGALEVLLARGIQVPGDVAVVGFDDTILSQTNTPPVTTVASSFYETGRQAAKTVLALMQGEQVPGETIVPSKLVVRQSCGCLDPAVTQAAVDPVKVRGKTSESVLASRRDQVLSAMAQAAGESSRNAVVGWESRLWDGFVGELKSKSPGLFLQRLDAVLRQAVAASGDVSAWQGAVSALRQQALPYLDGRALRRAENLWQQARVMIGETSRRAQAYQQLQFDRRTEILREIEVALVTTFDLAGLMDVLAQSLPRLGIPSCYLSLYEDPQPYQYPRPAPEWSRLVLAYDGKGCAELEPTGRRFRSNQLVPEEMWPQERSFRFIVEPLYFQEHQLGVVLFEVGPREVDVYEALRVQISSALQGALLTQERERAQAALEKAYAEVEKQVEERTAELQQEIIEHRQAQEALVHQQYLMRSLMDNTPDHIYFKDTRSRFIRMNKAQATQFGMSDPAEAIGKTDFDFFSEEHARQAYADERQVIETGQPIIGLEEKETWPDGHETWASTTKLPLRDEEGRIVGTFGLSRDITERKRAEAELTAAREMEQKFSEQLATLVAVTNELSKAQTLDELCRRAVEAGRNRLGFDRLGLWFVTEDHTTMLGTYGTGIDGQTTDERHTRHPIVRTARLQPIIEGSIALQRYEDAPLYQTDGKQIGVGERTAVGLWDGETVIGFLSVDNLISRRPFTNHDCELLRLYTSALGHLCTLKRAQENLAQFAKALEQRVIERTAQLQAALKEMEAFSYSVSHDLRAPLRAIDGFSHILMDEYAPQLPPEATRYLETICDSAWQMGHLVDGLLAFSRLGRLPLYKKPIDTADLVRQALDSLSSEQAGRRIEISIGELPAGQGDPVLLRQVWANLLSNALKFTRGRSLARIEIGCTEQDGEQVYFVKDNGVGFDMQYADKLFGVFQRLHRDDEFAGTGIGLAIVQRIITRHGGRVWAEAEVNKGATFYFVLPPIPED